MSESWSIDNLSNLREAFKFYDTDNDGVVNLLEL